MRALAPRTLLLAALVVALGGAAPSFAQNAEARVRVDRVRVEPLAQTVPVLGRLVARQSGMVAARVDGPVEAFSVEVGDRVEKDEIIAILDRRILQARRNEAAARLVRSKAELETARAELALAGQDLKRLDGLKSSAAFSQARYDDAKQQVTIDRAQVREAEASVLSAEADLELADIDLAHGEIRAPYPGVIGQRMTEAGAYVRSGDAIVRLVGDLSLEIEADIPFNRLGGLTIGRAVAVTLDDGSDHSASVRAFLPEENPLTRTRAVRFVPEFAKTLRPLAVDQSVTVHVPIGGQHDVLTVHKDAVIKNGTASLVFVVKEGTAEARQIKLGESTGSRFEVLGGLSEDEQVVVRGNERLQPGDKVQIDGAT
ncbi:MAG: efflux RND transporter periplasmic adaptor subunit [Pseudomonadota bacterium]